MPPPTTYREYVEQVRVASDLVALVAERFTLVANMIVCPFHADTRPSLNVHPTKQFFYCFGCKLSGDVFTWVEKIEGLTFRQAVEFLAARAQVAPFSRPPDEAQSMLSERQVHDAVEWFSQYYQQRLTAEAWDYIVDARRLPEDFIERFRIGWSDGSASAAFLDAAGPTWIPILHKAGVTVERQGRQMDHIWERVMFPGLLRQRALFLSGRTLEPDVEPKYLNQRGMDALLYNEEDLDPNMVCTVEGQIDALSLCADGLMAIGCLGGVKTRHLQKLKRVKKQIFTMFDADRAGRESTVRLAEALGEVVRVVALPEGQDPNDILRTTPGPHRFAPYLRASQDPVLWALDLCPKDAPPIEAVAHFEPLFRLLARRSMLVQEIYWEQWVVPRLKLSPAAAKRSRQTLIEYSEEARKRCSHCGAELLRG